MSLYGEGRMKQASTNAAELRKIKKPLIEKRRRDRMNRCLDELRSLVVAPCSDESVRNTKMEKADILEKTVVYLKVLHAKIENNKMLTDTKTQSSYENDEDEENHMQNNDNSSKKTTASILTNSPTLKTKNGHFKTEEEEETSDDSFRSQADLKKSLKKQIKSTKLQLQHLQKQQKFVERVGYNNGFRKCIEDVETYFKKLENSRECNILLRSSLIDYLNFYASELQSKLQIENRLFERFTQNISENFTFKQLQKVAKVEYDDNSRLIVALHQTEHENLPHLKQQLSSPFPTPPLSSQTTTNVTSNNINTSNNIKTINNNTTNNNNNNINNKTLNNNNDIPHNTHNSFKRLPYDRNQTISKNSHKTSRKCPYIDSQQQVPSKIQKYQTLSTSWHHDDTDPASKPPSNNSLSSHNSLPSQGIQDTDHSEHLEFDRYSTNSETFNCFEDFHCIKTLIRQDNQQNNIKDSISCNIKDSMGCNIKDSLCCNIKDSMGCNIKDSMGCNIKDSFSCNIKDSIPLNCDGFKTDFSSYPKNKLISSLSFWRPWNALLT